jgi:hypothetical protein
LPSEDAMEEDDMDPSGQAGAEEAATVKRAFAKGKLIEVSPSVPTGRLCSQCMHACSYACAVLCPDM